MKTEATWKVAAMMERSALGYYKDANRYRGWRALWRQRRGEELMLRAYALLGLEP